MGPAVAAAAAAAVVCGGGACTPPPDCCSPAAADDVVVVVGGGGSRRGRGRGASSSLGRRQVGVAGGTLGWGRQARGSCSLDIQQTS